MDKTGIPTLTALVAGDPGTGKENFIKRFLFYKPPSAEVRRKNCMTYFVYKPDEGYKTQLQDVSDIKTFEHQLYDNVDAVFFCYAANDPESFHNLEKWIHLMKVVKKEMHSFLVADMSNVGSQRVVAEFIAEKAIKLKERFRIKRFIESSFDDEESSAMAFQIILNEVSPPKLNEISLGRLYIKSTEKLPKTFSTERLPCICGPYRGKVPPPVFPNCGNGDIEKKFLYGNLTMKFLKLSEMLADQKPISH